MKRLLSLLLATCSTLALAQSPTTIDGVFSKAQAQRGKNVYTKNCQGCHSNNLQREGIEPPLIDTLFIDAWREDKLFSLYDFISTRMPKEGRNTKPGSLTPQQAIDVITYILDRNGYPSGTAELTQEQLTTTQFVGLNGPEPLPQSAMVRYVGCLKGSDDSYSLTQATEPFRVRVIDETDEHEVAQSQAAMLGIAEVSLSNVKQLTNASDVAGLQGKKVQAKGVLNLENGNSSLHVLTLVATGADCQSH